MMIQLPDDVVSKGYKQTAPYQYKQVFYSPSNDFEGTELDFVYAGLAYQYNQLDKFTRVVDISSIHPLEQIRIKSLR